jgi:hypothetical protein
VPGVVASPVVVAVPPAVEVDAAVSSPVAASPHPPSSHPATSTVRHPEIRMRPRYQPRPRARDEALAVGRGPRAVRRGSVGVTREQHEGQRAHP